MSVVSVFGPHPEIARIFASDVKICTGICLDDVPFITELSLIHI